MRTDLQTRPVYVRTRAHIEAHFAIRFLALLVTRLLERWTSLPAGQLLDAIRHFDAVTQAITPQPMQNSGYIARGLPNRDNYRLRIGGGLSLAPPQI